MFKTIKKLISILITFLLTIIANIKAKFIIALKDKILVYNINNFMQLLKYILYIDYIIQFKKIKLKFRL